MKLYAIEFSAIYNYDTLLVGITVPVDLINGANKREVYAKIDTGSSHCIFERKHGERLGIDVESGTLENFGTATGGFKAYGHELTLSVLGVETFSTVYFAADEYFARNVLGRQGWLDRVRLGLVDYEGKLFMSPYNEVV
jgi:hypothetical protein